MRAAGVRRAPGRRRRHLLGVIGLLAVAGAPGCGGRSGAGGACADGASAVLEEREVDVPYSGPTRDAASLVAAPAPRLVVQVTNSQGSDERVRLAFDGVDALDVDLPAGAGCGQGGPVYSISYDRPPGPVDVQLDLQGATSTSTIDVPATGTVWAVVDVQSKREWGDITVYDRQPAWG